MTALTIDVPEDLLTLLQQSALAGRGASAEIRIALAAILFQQGVVSAGKAAQLSGEPRAVFEQILADVGIPVVCYDEVEYARDLEGIARVRGDSGRP